jgi:hypothetical protein
MVENCIIVYLERSAISRRSVNSLTGELVNWLTGQLVARYSSSHPSPANGLPECVVAFAAFFVIAYCLVPRARCRRLVFPDA